MEIIWILGFGWEGSYFLEDIVCVGAIVYSLFVEINFLLDENVGNDEVFGVMFFYF